MTDHEVWPLSWAQGVDMMVDHALADSNDVNVVLGPVTWQPADNAEGRRWYFIVATSDADGFRCDQLMADTREETDRLRAGVMLALVQRPPPLVVHDTGDELYMARLCEILWPGDRITKLRQNVESEYQARTA